MVGEVVASPHQVSYSEYRLEFPGEPGSVHVVRGVVRVVCDSWYVPQDVTDTMVLLASEVVTNAVAVSEGEVLRMTLRRVLDYLYFNCCDYDPAVPGTPPMPDAEGLELSGRGLALVKELSASCGWEPLTEAQGKICWLTLAVECESRSQLNERTGDARRPAP